MKKFLFFFSIVTTLMVAGCSDSDVSVAPNLGNGGSSGTGGSMARFTISGNKLYVVDQTSLRTFDISTSADPKPATTIPIGIGIETVFPYGNNLFIGAADAMYIFDISNPSQPRQISRYDHFVGCDPVVVQGNYAYVTLRTAGCRPGFNSNVLDVIDLSDMSQPRVINSLQMLGPYGLGVRGNALFVCEGDKGMRVFDVTDPQMPVEKSFISDIKTYDVIPLPQSLLVTGEDGFRQYDYSDLTKLKLLSKIDVVTN